MSRVLFIVFFDDGADGGFSAMYILQRFFNNASGDAFGQNFAKGLGKVFRLIYDVALCHFAPPFVSNGYK